MRVGSSGRNNSGRKRKKDRVPPGHVKVNIVFCTKARTRHAQPQGKRTTINHEKKNLNGKRGRSTSVSQALGGINELLGEEKNGTKPNAKLNSRQRELN